LKLIAEKIESIDDRIPRELLYRADLSYFAEEVLGMEISNHHKVWSAFVAKHKKLCINAPRDHGKSFMFSFAYAIWRAYHNWIPSSLSGDEYKSIPRISSGYIFSNTQDQSVKLLEIVKHELESNPKLEHLLPARKDTWSKTEIRLSNNSIIRARGWGQSVRGAHPVWIVCDDVLNDETIYSEVTRNKQIDYFFSAVTPMLVPGGQLAVVGTPFHQEDLYTKLKQNKTYTFHRSPALSETGEPLWPTRYSKQMLIDRKEEVGSTRFAREYLCLPISDESSLFPERILTGCYDHQYTLPNSSTHEMRANLRVYTGVDLAMSSTVGADYTVITTIGVDAQSNRWLLNMRRKKGLSLYEQLREIEDVYKSYKPQKVLIEDNSFQRVFRDELIRNTDIPVEGFTTTANKKNALDRGVPSLQILFENRKFVIPRATERDREITDILVNELKCFTWQDGKLQGLGAHDDCVMSLWLANEAVNSSKFEFSFV
jgi:hypothetical protein